MTGQAVPDLAPAALLSEDRDERQTQNWRFDRLVDLGLDRGCALALVIAGVSWHDVEELLSAGCPVELVEGILL